MEVSVVCANGASSRRTSGARQALAMAAILAWPDLLDNGEILWVGGRGHVGHVGLGRRTVRRDGLDVNRALGGALRRGERLARPVRRTSSTAAWPVIEAGDASSAEGSAAKRECRRPGWAMLRARRITLR